MQLKHCVNEIEHHPVGKSHMNEIHKNNDLFFYVILNPCLFYAQNFEIG